MLTSKVGLRPGERVLDAGCGARVVGVNLSPGQIHRARRLAHTHGVSDRVSFGRQDFT
jgi:cyclopropane fatty-acyl-phospholipid synthase-like methyltransferase